MPFSVLDVVVAIILTAIIVVVIVKLLTWRGPHQLIGGPVHNSKHCDCCKTEPLQLIVKFDSPLEINVNVNVKIESPEPEVRGLLTFGPVREKQTKGV